MTAVAEILVTKGELARRAGVTQSAISKYFERGILGPDVLDGEGQRAKVKLEPALRQIRLRRDPSQALGNGFKVNTGAPDLPASADLLSFPPTEANLVRDQARDEAAGAPRDEIGDALRRTKLQREEISLRRAQAEEREAQGLYMRTDQVQAGYAKVAAGVMTAIEGAIPEIAQEMAAELDVPARDAQHVIRKALAKARTKAADLVRRTLQDLPATVPDEAPDPA